MDGMAVHGTVIRVGVARGMAAMTGIMVVDGAVMTGIVIVDGAVDIQPGAMKVDMLMATSAADSTVQRSRTVVSMRHPRSMVVADLEADSMAVAASTVADAGNKFNA